MRIVCPACAAGYEVPAERLAPGRTVRCARCGVDWTPVPAEPEPAESPLPESAASPLPAPAAPDVPREPAAPPPIATDASLAGPALARGGGVALRLAWALSVLALLAAAWGAYAGRGAVMQAWPPSVRAYAAIGLADAR